MTHRLSPLAARLVAALAVLVGSGCGLVRSTPAASALPPSASPTLRGAFADDFLVGAALNGDMVSGRDSLAGGIVAAQFNAATPENVMKWEVIHPEPEVYDWSAADAFVDYARARGLFAVGHTLVWHSQTPGWAFEHPDGTPLTRDELLARMEMHITSVVGRYRGRIAGWDVVNEALAEDGSMRDSPWLRIIGPDYVAHAFRFAHAADPSAELYYNDYSLENPPKRAGAIRLVRSLLDAGIPVTGVGTQGHYNMGWPTPAGLDSTIRELAPLGDIIISELDIDVLPDPGDSQSADVGRRESAAPALDPYADGLPADVQRQLAARYAELFRVLVRHRDAVSRVTFWGVTDGDSWRNGWPIAGRTNYPLLFDRDGRPKPAYDAVIGVVTE